jgi:hypothetical protein
VLHFVVMWVFSPVWKVEKYGCQLPFYSWGLRGNDCLYGLLDGSLLHGCDGHGQSVRRHVAVRWSRDTSRVPSPRATSWESSSVHDAMASGEDGLGDDVIFPLGENCVCPRKRTRIILTI